MMKVLSVVVLVAGLIVPAAGMAAEPLGRLFFTPAERNMLDAGKHAATQAPPKPGPRTVRLSGVVTRSDAERTVWINGTAYHNGAPEGVQVGTDPKSPATTSIRMNGKTATARVKVGQRLDLNSGKIRDDFSRSSETMEDAASAEAASAARPLPGRQATDKVAPVTGNKDGAPPTAAR